MAKGIIINISGSGEGAAEALRLIEAKMQETASEGTKMSEQLAAAGETVRKAFDMVGVGIGIREAISGVQEMISSSIELGETLSHLHAATGISVNDLSALRLMAMENGIDFESLAKAFKKLSTTVFELHENNRTARDAFAALGLSVKDVDATGGDLYKLLGLISDKFKEMPDGATKAAIATELLGRQSQDLVKVLNEGSSAIEEIKSRAPIFTDQDLERMEEMRKSAADLKNAWQMLSLSLTSSLEPALVTVMNWFSHNFEAGITAMTDSAMSAVKTLASAAALFNIPGAANIADSIDASQKQETAQMLAAWKERQKPSPAPGPGNQESPDQKQSALSGVSAVDVLQAHADWAKGQIEGGAGDAIAKTYADAFHAGLLAIRQRVSDQIQMDTDDATAAWEKQMQDAQNRVLDIFKSTAPKVVLDDQGQDQSWMTKGNPHAAENQQLKSDALAESAATITGFMSQLSEGAMRGKENFRSMVESAITEMERFAMMVMEQKAIIPILNSIFGMGGAPGLGFNPATSGVGTTSLAGLDMSAFQGKFAGGGDLNSGWAVVGDGGDGSGSELFAPKGPGTVLPHDVLEGIASMRNGGGSAPNVTVNTINNTSQPVQQKTSGVSWDGQARQFVIHTVLEDMQQGGPLAGAMSGFAPR